MTTPDTVEYKGLIASPLISGRKNGYIYIERIGVNPGSPDVVVTFVFA